MINDATPSVSARFLHEHGGEVSGSPIDVRIYIDGAFPRGR